MKVRKYRFLCTAGFFIVMFGLVAFAYYKDRVDAVFSLSGSGLLVLYAMYEYNLKCKEQIEHLDIQYQTKQFYHFRKSLIILRRLLKRVHRVSNIDSLTIFAEEVVNSLLKNSSVGQISNLTIELLKPENSSFLETTVRLVRENNKSVKVLKDCRSNIYHILNDMLYLFPVYSLLLSTLFDLLLFYKQSKVSTKRIVSLLHNKRLQQDIKNNIAITATRVSPFLQITSILSEYIFRQPSVDLKVRQVVVTETISNTLYELIDLLIETFISLDNEKLQTIIDSQQPENLDNVSNIFMEACSVYLNRATSDLSSPEKKDIFNIYNKLTKLLVDSRNAGHII